MGCGASTSELQPSAKAGASELSVPQPDQASDTNEAQAEPVVAEAEIVAEAEEKGDAEEPSTKMSITVKLRETEQEDQEIEVVRNGQIATSLAAALQEQNSDAVLSVSFGGVELSLHATWMEDTPFAKRHTPTRHGDIVCVADRC